MVSQIVTTSFSSPFRRMYQRPRSGSRSTASTAGPRPDAFGATGGSLSRGEKPTDAAQPEIAASHCARCCGVAIGEAGTPVPDLSATHQTLGCQLLVGRVKKARRFCPGEVPGTLDRVHGHVGGLRRV